MKYPSGQPMPEFVLEALTLAAKTGFITRTLWTDYFAVGTKRWANRQLQTLVTKGYLEPHPNPIASNCFVSTQKGRFLINVNSELFFRAPLVQQLVHDELLAHTVVKLARSKFLSRWRCENELRVLNYQQLLLNKETNRTKYPDLYLSMKVLNEQFNCTVEYERSEKSSSRYRDILKRYEAIESLWMILFVCETLTIQNRIKGQLKNLRSSYLNSRVATVIASEWRTDPLAAELEIGPKRFCLNDLRTNPNECGASEHSPQDGH